MKIKLALIDKDINYLNRITNVFNTRYSDKFEIYAFSDINSFLNVIESTRIDVLLVAENIDFDLSNKPSNSAFAYLVESPDIESYKNNKVICKFQKADLIYKNIISIYAELASNVTGVKIGNDNCKVLVFSSPCGGTGTSSVAAACAYRYARGGKKTLYLNLETFGTADTFFSGQGQFDMSDIIYALKSKKSNFAMKLESCVKQDNSGVYFYSGSKVALDMMEFTHEDINKLISELKMSSAFTYIIIDIPFALNNTMMDLYAWASSVIWVSDGSETANCKIERAVTALLAYGGKDKATFSEKIMLMYNRFSNKTGQNVKTEEIKLLGGAPRYEGATSRMLIEQLSNLVVFDSIG